MQKYSTTSMENTLQNQVFLKKNRTLLHLTIVNYLNANHEQTHTIMSPPIFREASIWKQLESGQLEKFLSCKQKRDASLPVKPLPPSLVLFTG